MKKFKFEYKATLIYFILGIIWIIFSDKLIVAISNPDNVNLLHSVKGSFFVVFGSLLIFFLIKIHLRKLRQTELNLQKQNQEYEELNEEYKIQNFELLKAKEKAEESDRLKSAFLKNISHEIRTPMNSIIGFSNLLLQPNITIDKQKQYTNILHKSINQLLSVIEEIITIALIETNQLKINEILFNPYKLISELFDEYQRKKDSFQKSAFQLKTNIPPNEETKIKCDYTRLTQIFKILLENAFKFTVSGEIVFGYSFTNNDIIFFVKDTGIGIPKEKQVIILKTFTQSDETIQQTFGGVGLGLSIVNGLIKLMKGQLIINSDTNTGTEIKFTIPIEKTEVTKIQITDMNVKTENWQNKTLLVAEDEEFNFIYIEELLANTKIKVIHAINGKKAVEICKNQFIDLILMDIKMPEMDGFIAVSEIRKFNETVPIIAQTAYSYKREDCLNSGFTDYISKPFDRINLTKIIELYVKK